MTYDPTSAQIILIIFLVIWELLWKGIALWEAAHRNQRNWFIAILIISSAGALPIFYLLLTGFHEEEVEDSFVRHSLPERKEL